jgi:hypothetical protein
VSNLDREVARVLETTLGGTLFIFLMMFASVSGLWIARRFTNIEQLRRQHEVASFFFLMIGTLYAVLIAFAIFVVWTQFQNAGANLEHEANEVGDLSRMSVAMPPPLRDNIRTALLEYVNSVLNDEFPAMAEGRSSQRTWNAVENLWGVYNSGQASCAAMAAYCQQALAHLNELCNYRRIRLFTSRGTVPAMLWYLLYIGGGVLVVFTYFFGHESLLWQSLMTAAMSGVLAFSLFLIYSYDSPFSGAARVSPAPFQLELEHVSRRQ